MCPDRQMLSMYVDGELPSPWKEKLEVHLGLCPGCARQIEVWYSLRRGFALDAAEVEAVQARVWARLAGREALSPPERRGVRSLPHAAAFWSRRVSVPLPAFAAAALALVVFAFSVLAAGRSGGDARTGNPASLASGELPITTDIVTEAPVSSMSDVLRYLDGEGSTYTVIRLPESGTFTSVGEPSLIKASDYSRSRRLSP